MKRHFPPLNLVILLLVVNLATGLSYRAYRQEQTTRALLNAIYREDTPAALAALKRGADPNAGDIYDNSSPSFRTQLQPLLDKLRHTETDWTKQPFRSSALMLCFAEGFKDNPVLVKALLDAGADPNDTTGDQISLVMSAAQNGWPQTLQLLLAHGGNVHQIDAHGYTPLHYATEPRTPESVQVILLLLDAGADINTQNENGETPLHCACLNANLNAVRILLKHHASVTIRDKHGRTAMDAANYSLIYDIIGALRQAGAKTGKELDAARSMNRDKAENQESKKP